MKTFEDFSSASSALLDQFILEVQSFPQSTSSQHDYVFRQARNIQRLATEIRILASNGCSLAIPIVTRATIESLGLLVAAVVDPYFAASKIIGEASFFREKCEEIWGNDFDPRIAETQREMDALVAGLRESHQIPNTQKQFRKLEAVWEVADMKDQFQVPYFLMSLSVHSNYIALLHQPLGIGSELVGEEMVMAEILAVAFAAQVLPTACPQKHIDDASSLFELINQSHAQKES